MMGFGIEALCFDEPSARTLLNNRLALWPPELAIQAPFSRIVTGIASAHSAMVREIL
jgi:hypothetical protein